jgi:hypothetical protein
MKRTSMAGLLCAALSCAPLLGACTAEPPAVNQVQTNLVDKAIFEGEWWYSSTAIDVSYDEAAIFNSAGAFAPFEGSMSTDYGLDYNRSGPNVIGSPTYSFPIARIRWVIDEHYLFAYRSYELVAGGNADGRSPDYRGEPLAVFKIVDHVDTRKDYNPITGEKTNVTVENKTDRKWYERKYMRVDWSQNLITDFSANDAQANELFTAFERESTPFFIQDGVDGYPESYKPQFVRVEDEKDYRFGDEWPKDQRDKVHYMSFVTKEVWSPGSNCLTVGGTCAAASVTMRNAFLRVPPEHEYAVQSMTNREFDHFGVFRSHQPTYARGGDDVATTRTFCTDDSQCAGGGSCDTAQNICVGGLTGDRGETDFLSFYMSRQNPYADSLTDKACVSDWECDGRHLTCDGIDDEKDRAACEAELTRTEGSTCDPSARRCTIPLRSRPLRKIDYRLSAHFPPYLVRDTFDAVAQWNEALMRGRRAALGQLPIDQVECDEGDEAAGDGAGQQAGDGLCTVNLSKEAPVECQNDNPGAYCYCGSPEAQGGRCSRAYDPFESPEQARKRGVPNPYDCYVKGPADVTHPKDYADYKADKAYAYEFVGKECVLTLAANPCDVDPKQACLELGDLRYQFLTHVQHGSVAFGGVTQPLSDPTTGELVVSNATVSGESIESAGTTASQFFPVLRGDEPEDQYFSGENLRGYYARLGKVDYPVSLAPSGTDGYSVSDSSRPPSSQAQQGADRFQDLDARMQRMDKRLEQLKGQEGRVAILSDRLRDLKGTSIAARLDAVVEADSAPAALAPDGTVNPDLLPDVDTAAAASTASAAGTPKSIVDESPLDAAILERKRHQVMGARNMDDFGAKLYNAQYYGYWAAAFAGYPLAESALRMQQIYHRSVMVHELGHAMGLQHNFAGSLDRNNYHDAYYNIARTQPLPAYLDYDDPALGGNADGAVNGAEAQRWAADLRDVRQDRLDRGAGNVMTSSVMDYDGDLSGYSGIGRYDSAAILFSYFDKVESYDTPDPTVYPGNLPEAAQNASSLSGLTYADSYRRDLWTYYRGGETCQRDVDCPNGAGRETSAYQPITQRCVSNPRTPNTTGSCADGGCICSNYYDDMAAYTAGTAYRASKSSPKFAPVSYLYCNDNRINDLSWCTQFDAGESFQEVIDHYRLSWLQRYPQVYFRNYRRSGPSRGYSQSTVVDAVKIYQHLFFRYYYDGASFRNSQGPLGYRDQLFASADVLNWLGEIIAAPDVGTYAFDADAKTYRQISTDPDDGSGDVALPPGQGFYLWSQYQSGQNGFFRLERAGTFLDKLLAIESLARRDWGLSYTLDERYFTNFYDIFEKEVIDLFGGLILRNPKAYAPRVTMDDAGQPKLSYMSLYRMDMDGSNESRYPQPALDGSDSEVLRDAAAIQALAQFPIYYDTSFEQRLLVFRTGSGEGYEIPKTRGDGTPTCAYGDEDCDAPDYIVYDSDRLHTTFVAVIIQPNREQGIDEQQLGFQLLLELKQQQQKIRELEAKKDPTDEDQSALLALRQGLQRDETFVDYLIELERVYGISTSLF